MVRFLTSETFLALVALLARLRCNKLMLGAMFLAHLLFLILRRWSDHLRFALMAFELSNFGLQVLDPLHECWSFIKVGSTNFSLVFFVLPLDVSLFLKVNAFLFKLFNFIVGRSRLELTLLELIFPLFAFSFEQAIFDGHILYSHHFLFDFFSAFGNLLIAIIH